MAWCGDVSVEHKESEAVLRQCWASAEMGIACFHKESEAVLGFCNWVAPAHLKASFTSVHSSLMGTVASDSPQSITLILQPAHSNQKGQVWQTTSLLFKGLVNHSLNLDTEFSVLVSERSNREDRPGVYSGRVAYPLGAEDIQGKEIAKGVAKIKPIRVCRLNMWVMEHVLRVVVGCIIHKHLSCLGG